MTPTSDREVLKYFESLDSMEGLLAPSAPAAPSRLALLPKAALLQVLYPGVLAAGTIGLAATWQVTPRCTLGATVGQVLNRSFDYHARKFKVKSDEGAPYASLGISLSY
jgi:hypothetical protein